MSIAIFTNAHVQLLSRVNTRCQAYKSKTDLHVAHLSVLSPSVCIFMSTKIRRKVKYVRKNDRPK